MPSPIPIPKERDKPPISPNRGTNHATSLLGKSHRHIRIPHRCPPRPHWAKGSPNQELHDPSHGESSTTSPQSPSNHWRRNTNPGFITPRPHWAQGSLLSELQDPLYGESSSVPPQNPTAHRQKPNPPTWFLDAIKSIAGMYLPPTVPSSFQFHASTKAAEHNKKIIESHGGLQQAIEEQQNSTVSYGSEFCLPWCLHRLLHHHPLWSHMTVRLSQGSTYPLNPISDVARQ